MIPTKKLPSPAIRWYEKYTGRAASAALEVRTEVVAARTTLCPVPQRVNAAAVKRPHVHGGRR